MNEMNLPSTRKGKIKKIKVGTFDIYITVNCLRPGKPAEVFITIAKHGGTMAALFDALATTISVALQHGVPWPKIRDNYLGHNFEPRDDKGNSILHCVAAGIEELCMEMR